MPVSASECPYVGLEPFEISHSEYFFGRSRDSKIIADHVLARPTTILYGPSGVGKTSILNVGLRSALPQRQKWIIVCLRDWQDPNRIEQLAIDQLLAELPYAPHRSRDRVRFVPLVAWAIRTMRCPVVLILDQFEEYFRYRNADHMRENETAIGHLIGRRDLPMRVLISLREDALFELDNFRAFVPTILDTTIRLGHLSNWDVEDAIRKPVQRYNERYRTGQLPPIEVEDGLVAALIQQLGEAHPGIRGNLSPTSGNQPIELPYLQLTLKKLWEREGGAATSKLREKTLTDPRQLGGVNQVMRDHVNYVMEQLTLDEQDLCAKMFDRLVTSIGSKVAYPTAALASANVIGSRVSSKEIEAVLWKLTPKESRILKPTLTSGGPGFEIFHDVLGPPVLEWRQAHETDARSLQFIPTRSSVANDTPSILAMFETILATVIYWWSAAHFETYAPLLAGIVLAPFILLQSDEAISTHAMWLRRLRSDTSDYYDVDGNREVESLLRFFLLCLLSSTIWVMAIAVNPRSGVQRLPRNFRRLMLCRSIIQCHEVLYQDLRRLPKATAVLLILPCFLYYLVSKSAAWFWWPLAFLGGDLSRRTNPNLLRYRMLGSVWGRSSIILSLITLVSFLVANVLLSGSVLADTPSLYLVQFLFIFDWNGRPWQLLPLLMASSSLAIVFALDYTSAEYRFAQHQADAVLLQRADRKLQWIERMTRFRSLLSVAFFFIAGFQALLYLNSVKCWFNPPAGLQDFAHLIYGEHVPQACRYGSPTGR